MGQEGGASITTQPALRGASRGYKHTYANHLRGFDQGVKWDTSDPWSRVKNRPRARESLETSLGRDKLPISSTTLENTILCISTSFI